VSGHAKCTERAQDEPHAAAGEQRDSNASPRKRDSDGDAFGVYVTGTRASISHQRRMPNGSLGGSPTVRTTGASPRSTTVCRWREQRRRPAWRCRATRRDIQKTVNCLRFSADESDTQHLAGPRNTAAKAPKTAKTVHMLGIPDGRRSESAAGSTCDDCDLGDRPPHIGADTLAFWPLKQGVGFAIVSRRGYGRRRWQVYSPACGKTIDGDETEESWPFPS
jgi:hypothetical protein